MKKITLEMDDCKGATSTDGSRHYTANKKGQVTVDNQTAEGLIRSRTASARGRLFGGFTLPTPPQENPE